MHLTVYTKPSCPLCEDVLQILDRLAPEYGLEVTEVNILNDTALYEAYHEKIPVVQVGDGRFGRLVAPIDEAELRSYLALVRGDRVATLPYISILPPRREPLIDRVASYIGRHWLRFACIVLFIFIGLPWLAPVFAALGWWAPADMIYTAYAFQCHQLPERAGHVFGFEVATCYRCSALYGGMAFCGLLYGLARDRKVTALSWLRRPIPWPVFVLFLLPIAVDGISHMLGVRDNIAVDASFGSFYFGSQPGSLNWWLRIITGGLAALGTVWFAFPRMDRAVGDAEAMRLAYRRSAVGA